MDLAASIVQQKNDTLNRILVVVAVFFTVGILGSLARTLDQGWQPLMYLHIGIGFGIYLLVAMRKKLSYDTKAVVLIGVSFAAAFGGLLTYGLIGGNITLWLYAIIMCAAFFSLQAGIWSIIALLISFTAIAIACLNGWYQFSINAEEYQYTTSSWISIIVGTSVFAYIVILIISSMNHIINQNLARAETQRLALDQANATKDKLFSVIAHDLRNPISGLIGALELMQVNGAALDQQQKDKLMQNMLHSIEGTHQLLENLLTWAKSEQNDLQIHYTEVALVQIINESVAPYKSLAAKKTIQLETPTTAPTLTTYEQGLRIVLSNLINNAIKYTKEQGTVCIRIATTHEQTSIQVIDTGIGMSTDVQQKLLEFGTHHTTAGTHGELGTGIGIKLCHNLAQKCQGTLSITSAHGSGSTFSINLPNSIHTA